MLFRSVVDAEEVLAENIKDEASHLSEVAVPEPTASDIDVTDDAVADEFTVMDLEDEVSPESDTVLVATDEDESEEA